MASIDDKVVSITFDNKGFEKGVSQTLKTLADLKGALDFKGGAAGLEEVSAAASKFSLAGIGDAVQGISSKFSAMGAVAFSVINNITTKAMDAGLQLAKAFTIAPVMDGFAEYELKMGSIQTIMSGSGESLAVVNAKLEELNRYSDETIYSFADMTQNIGKFTNAGLSLDQSVASIQGIANVAAISGANAEEASRAMYNFAQSLSAGSVKLIDWKSIENANMATAGFKTEILESAVAAGTLTKSVDGMYSTLEGTPVSATKGFNESLQEQWLTTEVLNSTLGRYSDTTTEIGKKATAAATDIKTFSQMMDTLKESAGSGWATTFENIFGDFEQGKALWTGIGNAAGDIISGNAEARNAVLKIWSEGGGRSLLIESLGDAMKALGSIISTVKDAFRNVFPAATGRDLLTMTVQFSKFVEKLQPSEKTLKNLKTAFQGFFDGIAIGTAIIKGVAKVIFKVLGAFGGGADGKILEVAAKIGEFITKIKMLLVNGGLIEDFFGNIGDAAAGFVSKLDIGPAFDAIKNVVLGAREAFLYFWDGVTGMGSGEGEGFYAFAMDAGVALRKLIDAIGDFIDSLDFSAVGAAVNSLKAAFKSLFTGSNGEEGLVPAAAGEGVSKFASVLSALGDAAKAVGRFISSIFEGIGKAGSVMGTIAGAIGNAVSGIWEAIANVFSGSGPPSIDNILKVLTGGALAAVAAAFVSFAKNGFRVDFGQFDFLDELSGVLDGVSGSLKAMQKDILAGALVKIATAIGILTLSLIALSFVNGTSLAKSMTAVAGGLTLLVGALAGIDKIANNEAGAGKIAILALSLTLIAGAMVLLALAAALMAQQDPETLTISLLGMLGALEMIGRVMEKLSSNTDGMVKAAFSVGVLALSLMLLAAAVALWSTLDPMSMALSLFAISSALTIISETMGNMPSDGMVKAALSVGILAVSLMILAVAIKMFSNIGLVDTAVGLTTMAVALDIIARVLKRVADNKDVEKAGLSILSVSFGMMFMARAIEKMGSLGLWSIIKGVGAFAIMLSVMGKAVKSTEQSLKGSAAMLIMAVAIYGFGMAIEKVAAIPFWDLVKGIGAIVLVMGIMAGVAALLAPAIPVLAGLGVGLALVGGAIFAFGAGVFFMASAVQILSQVGPAGVEVFIKAVQKLLKVLPSIAIALGEAAFMFVTSFLSGFDELIPMVVSLIGKLLEAIKTLVPQFLETAGTLIAAFLDYITSVYPAIVQAGWDLLLAFLNGIKENIGELASTAIGIVTNFITAMSEGIPDYVRAMVELWTTILTTMAFELGVLITTLGPQIGIALIDGILTGLRDTGGKILDFFSEWVGTVIGWVKGLFGINSPSTVFAEIGTFLIDGLLGGIVDTIGKVMEFFTNLLSDILGWIGDAAGALVGTGGDVITGLWNGHWDMIYKIADFFQPLLDKMIEWIGDALGGLRQTGIDIIKGLLNGIENWMKNVRDFFMGFFETVRGWIGDAGKALYNVGINLVIGLWNGIAYKFYGWMKDKLGWLAGAIPGWIKSALGINSPSKVMYEVGKWIPVGLGMGMLSEQDTLKKSADGMANAITNGFHVDTKELTSPIREAVSLASAALMEMDGIDSNPVITPVLDLSQVRRDSNTLGNLLNTGSNFSSALGISASTNAARQLANAGASGPTEVKYEQIINAPTALSTNDIYRQTRSLIAITKEEAKIP